MRLIDNICANIVKHGSPSQPVELTASVEEGFLVLRESNAVLRKTVKTAAGDSGYGLVICEDVMSALGAASPTERRTAASASSCAFPSCRAGNSRRRRKIARSPLPTGEKTAAIWSSSCQKAVFDKLKTGACIAGAGFCYAVMPLRGD